MTQEEIMKEILAKLPAEIVEKIKAKTITEDEVKQYLQPLLEQFKDQIEGFAPLSDEQLEAVNGSGILDNIWGTIKCLANNVPSDGLKSAIKDCFDDDDQEAKIFKAGRQEAKVR